MEVSVKYQNQNGILRISDTILGADRTKLSDIIQEQIEHGCKNIVLNLKNVTLMDSVGLGMLVALQTSLMRQNIRLVLSEVSRSVGFLLLTTKLGDVFEQYETEDEALAHLPS